MAEHFLRWLRRTLDDKKMSITALARKAEVNESTIRQAFRERRMMHKGTMLQIRTALGDLNGGK